MAEQNQIVPTQNSTDNMKEGQFMPAFRTFEDTYRFCDLLSKSTLVPKAYQGKPGDIIAAITLGGEIGLKWMQSLQSIATINGIPSIYGDAALALVRGSGLLEDFDEWIEVDNVRQKGSSFPIQKWADEGKIIIAYCMSKRKGSKRERISTYSVDDSKRAGLWGKAGPWTSTPQRMLMWRPRSWNLRDEFGDVLKGLSFYEEIIDIPPQVNPTEAIAAASQPETKGTAVVEQLKAVAEERGVEIPSQPLVLMPVEPAQIPQPAAIIAPGTVESAKVGESSPPVEEPKPVTAPLRAEIIKYENALRETPAGQTKHNQLLGALKVKLQSGQAYVDAVPVEQHAFYLGQMKSSLEALKKEPKK